jgi:HAD superfamily hydrolase (TIGR01509 family)
MPIRAVIFDLDGTITQSYLDFDVIRQEIGIGAEGGPILEAMETMDAQQRAHALRILDRHEEQAIEASTLNRDVHRVLEYLRRQQMSVGVLTRNTKVNAEAVVRKHGLNFDAIVGRDEAPVKPDPAGVLLLCRQFGVQPETALVVGDYLFDILSARAAGAVSVLLDVKKTLCEFTQHADFTIENLGELLHIVEQY